MFITNGIIIIISIVLIVRYVCVEMFIWGMGERIIKRYCEKMEPEDYEDILDNEARVSEGLEESDQDLNCEQTMDRGRQVTICR